MSSSAKNANTHIIVKTTPAPYTARRPSLSDKAPKNTSESTLNTRPIDNEINASGLGKPRTVAK